MPAGGTEELPVAAVDRAVLEAALTLEYEDADNDDEREEGEDDGHRYFTTSFLLLRL